MKNLILFTLLFIANFCQSQPGSLDYTFNGNGKVYRNIGDNAIQVIMQGDKILALGSNSLVRYNGDGSIDTTFKSFLHSSLTSVYLMKDGSNRMLVTGTIGTFPNMHQALFRVKYDGELDTNFKDTYFTPNTKGYVVTYYNATSVLINSQGAYLVVGGAYKVVGNAGIQKIDSTGNPLLSQIYPNSLSSFVKMIEQSDKKILVIGWYQVMRLDSNLSIDSTFGKNGMVVLDSLPLPFSDIRYNVFTSGDIQPNDMLILTSFKESIRLKINGKVDSSYRDTCRYNTSIKILSDGTVLHGGFTTPLTNYSGFTRCDSTGRVDNLFGGNLHKVMLDGIGRPNAITVQSDGKILVLSNNFLYRLKVCYRTYGTTDTVRTVCKAYTWRGKTYTSLGTYRDTLVNYLGCDSIVALNLTINQPLTIKDSVYNVCKSYTFANKVITNAGTYTDTVRNSKGCDSIINVLILKSIVKLDVSVDTTASASTLVSRAEPTKVGGFSACDSYKWFNCNDPSKILKTSTNDASFKPSQTGYYAAILTSGLCSDTTRCYFVKVIVGIDENKYNQSFISVYPNPTKSNINIELSEAGNVIIMNSVSEVVFNQLVDKKITINSDSFSNGIYFIRVLDIIGNTLYTNKIVLQ